MHDLPFLLYANMKIVEVGHSKPALFDLQEFGVLELLEVRANAALTRAHFFGQFLLPRKDSIVGPVVFQQHGVGELGADGEVLVGEDDVGHLREAMPRHRIGTDDLDVSLGVFEIGGDVIHRA